MQIQQTINGYQHLSVWNCPIQASSFPCNVGYFNMPIALTSGAASVPILAKQVVIGFVDVAAIGAQTLLAGCQGTSQKPITLQPLSCPELLGEGSSNASAEASTSQAAVSVLSYSDRTQPPALQLCTLGGTSQEPQVSMLIISAVVPQRQIPALCGALLDFIRKYAPGDVHITLAGGALLGKARESDVFYHFITGSNGSSSSSLSAPQGSKPLPADTLFRDPLLGALWEVLRVAGHSAAALLVPGHKPSSLSSDLSGSQASCAALGAALQALLPSGCWSFDAARCSSLAVSHKFWQDASLLGADSMYV